MVNCEGETALGSIVLLHTGWQLLGSCLWLRGWAGFLTSLTCLGDLPCCQLLKCIFRQPFHQNCSSLGALKHLNATKYSASHKKPCRLLLCWLWRRAKQNQTWVRLSSSREWTYEECCTQSDDKREFWDGQMLEFRPTFIPPFPGISLQGNRWLWCLHGHRFNNKPQALFNALSWLCYFPSVLKILFTFLFSFYSVVFRWFWFQKYTTYM